MVEKIIPNEQKLRELILYISSRCASDETFGAMKLNKLLFHADFLAYGQFQRPITGVEYMKLENGPVPRKLRPVRDEMIRAGDIMIERVPYFDMPKQQERVIALRGPKMELFAAEEIALVESVIRQFWGKSGTEVSEMTHGYRGWRIARDLKDTIPYEAVFLSDELPTEYELQHAHELIAQHGWDV